MKTPLGMEADIAAGHCMRLVRSAPRKGNSTPPPLTPMSIVATVAHPTYC